MKWTLDDTNGCGGFLDPPGYPTHTHSIREGSERDPNSILMLRRDLENYVPAEIRERAVALLDAWHANPPAIDSPEVQDWIRQVLGYFRNCWRGKGAEPECWNVSNLEIIHGPLFDGAQLHAIEHHAGVHRIRKFYPEFTSTAEDLDCGVLGDKAMRPITKGEWTVRQGGDHGKDPNAFDVVCGSQPIARGYWGGQADMTLCSAAPNLLASAESAIVTLGRIGCQFFACDGPDAPFEHMKTCVACSTIQDLRAAIAKARGA